MRADNILCIFYSITSRARIEDVVSIDSYRFFHYVYSTTTDRDKRQRQGFIRSSVPPGRCARSRPILSDFWKRSHCPSFVDRTPLATLTTYTSHSVRPPEPYLLSPLGRRTILPTGLPPPRYVNTRNEKAPHLSGRPTAVHRIVFRCHLSSRSGITLPR